MSKLSKYLNSKTVVADVAELLNKSVSISRDGKYKRLSLDDIGIQWDAIQDKKWTNVSVGYESLAGLCEFLGCYYRKWDENYYIVSDCCKSLAYAMKATGMDGEIVIGYVNEIVERGVAFDDVVSPGMNGCAIERRMVSEIDLPKAIVAVLLVVLKIHDAISENKTGHANIDG